MSKVNNIIDQDAIWAQASEELNNKRIHHFKTR